MVSRNAFAGVTDLYFTGAVYSINVRGDYHELALTDGYKTLCDTEVVAAYRKEMARVILRDTLDAAGIRKTAVTCPAVKIARFSTKNIPAEYCVRLLIKALEEHGCGGLSFFFDAENIFHFGTIHDTGKNEGAVFSFETGKNILRTGQGFIEVLPRPIRHTQKVKIDGRELWTLRTDLTVSRDITRLELWPREAL
jgi:hypothetical protein